MILDHRVALITGAGSGIGRASAILLAQEGARIGVLGRTRQNVQAVVAEIQGKGGQALPLVADVSNPEQVKEAIDRLAAEWGRLDIVFANAGVNGLWAPVEEIEPAEWDEVMDINLKGTFLTVKYAVPYLKKQGGSIIIDSSVNGTRMFSNTEAAAYATTKAGQAAFGKTVALQLARHKIRVNIICPGWIATEIGDNSRSRNRESVHKKIKYLEGIIPLTGGRPGTAEQVAQLVLFLASDASSLITGTEVWIDGGESLVEG